MAPIEFERVSKTFGHIGEAKLLRDHLEERFRRRAAKREIFYALKDISFHVEHGECMAIVGGTSNNWSFWSSRWSNWTAESKSI